MEFIHGEIAEIFGMDTEWKRQEEDEQEDLHGFASVECPHPTVQSRLKSNT